MTQHPIQTQLPDDDFDAFRDYCKHVRRSQAWVAREFIKQGMKQVAMKEKLDEVRAIRNEANSIKIIGEK